MIYDLNSFELENRNAFSHTLSCILGARQELVGHRDSVVALEFTQSGKLVSADERSLMIVWTPNGGVTLSKGGLAHPLPFGALFSLSCPPPPKKKLRGKLFNDAVNSHIFAQKWRDRGNYRRSIPQEFN